MLTLTLSISCLTTSNLPWFMELTLQVLMQYCSSQHRTCFYHQSHFYFGFISSFFLELFLQWSPVANQAPNNLGVLLSVSYLFAFTYCAWGSQGKNIEVVYHSLLQWTTFCQNSPPWPVHIEWPCMAWLSFMELDKSLVHVIRLVFCDCDFQSVWAMMEKDKRLMEASWRDRLTEGETGSCFDGWGHGQYFFFFCSVNL